jgi:hypothetical protein
MPFTRGRGRRPASLKGPVPRSHISVNGLWQLLNLEHGWPQWPVKISGVAYSMSQEHASVVCLQETKLSLFDDHLILKLLGSGFAFYFVPAVETGGGILIAWKSASWIGSHFHKEAHSLTIKLTSVGRPSLQWWLSVVYGPHRDQEKRLYLSELQRVRSTSWALASVWRLQSHIPRLWQKQLKIVSKSHVGIS